MGGEPGKIQGSYILFYLARVKMKSPTLSSVNILQRLKTSTADAHERVEERLQIFSPDFDLAAYIRLLTQFYGFWAPLEAELCKVSELHDPELKLETRLKSHLLQADLKIFGLDPSLVPLCCALPDVRTFQNSLGCLYVLEGSTLGSQFIAKHIQAKFQISTGSGASFFNAYGAMVGEKWSECRKFVTLKAEPEHEEEVLNAARQTFKLLYDWLVETLNEVSPASGCHRE